VIDGFSLLCTILPCLFFAGAFVAWGEQFEFIFSFSKYQLTMSKTYYKFPCSCGSYQAIEVSQAGSEIKCSDCGAVRVTPTMLKIKQLEEITDNSNQHKEETGTIRRGFFWFGLILFIPSFIALNFYTFFGYPHPRDVSKKVVFLTYGDTTLYQDSTPIPQHEHITLWTTDEHIDEMLPFDLFRYFEILKMGSNFSYNFQINYQELKYVYYTRVVFFSFLVILSAASFIASFFMPKKGVIIDGWSGSEWGRKKS
jgi:ribosomal protein S27E